MSEKRRCIFAHNPDGECPFYCGHTGDMLDLERGIANIVRGELCDMLEGSKPSDSTIQIHFGVRYLDDMEIETLPEL